MTQRGQPAVGKPVRLPEPQRDRVAAIEQPRSRGLHERQEMVAVHADDVHREARHVQIQARVSGTGSLDALQTSIQFGVVKRKHGDFSGVESGGEQTAGRSDSEVEVVKSDDVHAPLAGRAAHGSSLQAWTTALNLEGAPSRAAVGGEPATGSTCANPAARHMPIRVARLGDHQLVGSPARSSPSRNRQSLWRSSPGKASASDSTIAVPLVTAANRSSPIKGSWRW